MYGPEYLEWQEQERVNALARAFLDDLEDEDRHRAINFFRRRCQPIEVLPAHRLNELYRNVYTAAPGEFHRVSMPPSQGIFGGVFRGIF